MSVPVVMPQLGLTMTEGSVSEWLKKPGDMVRKGEMLFIVSTDKADMEVESLDEGHLVQIVLQPGNVVPVGTVIAYLGQPGETVAAAPASASVVTGAPSAPKPDAGAPPSMAASPAPSSGAPETREGGLPSSPRARKLARELGVDISKVVPSGGRDRIVEDDVRRFSATSKTPSAPVDLRRRRVIADRLTQSIQTIPHFFLNVEVRADQLVALRERIKESGSPGLKITVTDLLLKALAFACQQTPEIRVVWDDGNFRSVSAIDLGLAISADSGVVAPVMRNAASRSITEIAKWRSDAAEKARGGRLALTDLEGGIGTLSNLGMYRVSQFNAIISPGQSFILAVGKIENRPWVEGRGLIVTQAMNLTLSVDHRVADGAAAAKFLENIAAIIESPEPLGR